MLTMWKQTRAREKIPGNFSERLINVQSGKLGSDFDTKEAKQFDSYLVIN